MSTPYPPSALLEWDSRLTVQTTSCGCDCPLRLNASRLGTADLRESSHVVQEFQDFLIEQADRAYGMEISPRSFVISFVILLYAISYNIGI